MTGQLTKERIAFHCALINSDVLTFSPANKEVKEKFEVDKVVSNADVGQRASVRIASALAVKIEENTGISIKLVAKKVAGQTLGNLFEEHCKNYLERTFPLLNHLRPGTWSIRQVGTRNSSVLGGFEQYRRV
jgi:hypothetical protein